jgi:hypothetical protein
MHRSEPAQKIPHVARLIHKVAFPTPLAAKGIPSPSNYSSIFREYSPPAFVAVPVPVIAPII